MAEFEKYACLGRGINASICRMTARDAMKYGMIDAEGGHRLRREVIRQIKREIFEKK